MFKHITATPPDAILGLTEAFKNDTNPQKVNLGVGIYKDAGGQTPVLASVKKAEQRILATETTKSYLPIDGPPAYANVVREQLFGREHEIVASNRSVTAQTPGGTGALRVAADFIAKMTPNATVWISDPTWPNHPAIFNAAKLSVATYPYFDAATNGVDFDGMMAAIQAMPAGDVIVLHGCCHNPTGVDLTPAQWESVADLVAERNLMPLLDFAYQGFGQGLEEDAVGLRALCAQSTEMMIANSFSKNFGLYNERIGALTIVAGTADEAEIARSHMKRCIRTNYSNPPAHGSAIVTTVLTDPVLRAEWKQELDEMRNRIKQMRDLFVETLNEKGVDQDFSFIARQQGMFSFSGLTPDQVQALRERYSIYIVGSGRINVAGMTTANMDYLCEGIANVL